MHSDDEHNDDEETFNNNNQEADDIVDLVDMMGMPCDECHKGLFEETTVTDDIKGILHCDKCDYETKRYMLPEDLDNTYDDNNDLDGDMMEDKYHVGMNNHDDYSFTNDSKFDLDKFYAKAPVKKCTDSHPALPILINGEEFVMYGSSCQNPIVKNADLYISLDYNAPVYLWEQPWYLNEGNKQHLRFFIEDMSVTDMAEDFHDLVDFTVEAIGSGKLVHAGCIAGHGRTGTLLAAIVQQTMGDQLAAEGISAIDYVRDNYCKKAVETLSQVLFLYAEFGVAIPRKDIKLVEEFNEIFLEQYEVSFEAVIQYGEFMKFIPTIEDIDMQIYRKYNPPPPPISKFRTGNTISRDAFAAPNSTNSSGKTWQATPSISIKGKI